MQLNSALRECSKKKLLFVNNGGDRRPVKIMDDISDFFFLYVRNSMTSVIICVLNRMFYMIKCACLTFC